MGSRFSRPSLLLTLSLATISVGCVTEVKPTPNPVAGFELLVQRDGQPAETLVISADGAGCDSLGDLLSTVCRQAPNLLPSVIGGEAFGSLNEKDTPAFTALIWRARIDGDITVCERGGLLSPRLERCQEAAQDPNYVVRGEGLTVSVPLGQ